MCVWLAVPSQWERGRCKRTPKPNPQITQVEIGLLGKQVTQMTFGGIQYREARDIIYSPLMVKWSREENA